jgi:hypothetical protein
MGEPSSPVLFNIPSIGSQEIKMGKERKRSIKTAQLKMRELNFSIDGTAATPSASGFDQYGISSVIDLGAGNYTIIFRDPFERACQLGGIGMLTAGIIMQVTAVAYDRITVLCTAAATGAATDADFHMCVKGSDSRYDV